MLAQRRDALVPRMAGHTDQAAPPWSGLSLVRHETRKGSVLRHLRLSLFVIVASVFAPAAMACSSCGCTLNTDLGNQGVAGGQGWRLDFRYDLVDQTQLRDGGSAASAPVPAAMEVEQRTRNAYYNLGIDYGFDRRWGIDVQVPWVDRFHTTYGAGDTQLSTSDYSHALSDVRVLGRYTGFSPDMSTGVLFGFKLPTGATDRRFDSGPDAGMALDRGLQPGTGTTDLLLGAYHFDNLSESVGWFSQMLYQHALSQHQGYAAGDSINLNIGLRYFLDYHLIPQLQLNLQQRARDAGIEADPVNTGGRVAYLSPGVSFALNSRLHGFFFVQFPVYQQVNGLQLAPTHVYSIGASYKF